MQRLISIKSYYSLKSNKESVSFPNIPGAGIPNPLLEGGSAKVLQRIPVSWLVAEYRRQCGLEVLSRFQGMDEVILAACPETGFRFFYPPESAGNGDFYEELQHFDWYYVPWKWEHEQAMQHIRTDQQVLEIGCGRGDFLKRLKDRGQGGVFGIEMNETAAQYAREHHGLNVFTGSLAGFQRQHQQKFDVVCSFQVLEHVAEPGVFIREALDMLKPGGLFIIGVPNNDAVIVKDEPNNILDFPPHHMGWWNARSLKALCSRFSLDLVTLQKEPLPKDRITRYYFIRISRFRQRFGIAGRIMDKLMYPVSVPFLSYFRKWIPGHTIMAVYRKNQD